MLHVQVISAYNVVLRLARGPSVIATLDKLTRRLARLYLAGRVGCPAISTSGSACKQELHNLPDRFNCVNDTIRKNTENTSFVVMANRITAALEMDATGIRTNKTSLLNSEQAPFIVDMPPSKLSTYYQAIFVYMLRNELFWVCK